MSCLNTGGTDFKGEKFSKKVDVAKGDVQAMWCLVDIPAAIAPGVYEGTVTVSAKKAENTSIGVRIKVGSETAVKAGVNEPWKQTRLTWLNSTLAQKNDVIKPYTPLVVKGNSIALLGRKVMLDKNGFPQKIETFFTPEMTSLSAKPKEVIASPLTFVTENAAGKETWTAKGLNWDAYGHNPTSADPLAKPACTPDANGYNTSAPTAINYFEWCQDHHKPLEVAPFGDVNRGGPATLPDSNILTNGAWYGGSPYLGPDATTRATGPTGTTPPSGTVANPPGSEAGFAFMWHSHNEREITTNNIFPGGMMMMMLVDSREFVIDESN